MSGKARPSLRKKALDDVKHSNMSKAVKECIAEVFERYEIMVDSIPEEGIIADLKHIAEAEMLFHQREYKGEPIFSILFAVIDLINRKNVEIAMLKREIPDRKYAVCVKVRNGLVYTKSLEDYDWLIGDISAEAIKEFAEMVKKKGFTNNFCKLLISAEEIDQIAKEMGVVL